jgi:hypothetical protein
MASLSALAPCALYLAGRKLKDEAFEVSVILDGWRCYVGGVAELLVRWRLGKCPHVVSSP